MTNAWEYLPPVDSELAVELAQLFLLQFDEVFGPFSTVEHHAASRRYPEGGYWVTFEYAGPPVPASLECSRPPEDHPTVVIVDDRSGDCKMLPWL